MTPRAEVWFVGVSTGASRIHDVFPIWSRELGWECDLKGVDIPAEATPRRYRALIEAMRTDSHFRGAVITRHKLALFSAAHEVLTEVDLCASLLEEINAIAHLSGGGLAGHARDPIAVARLLPNLVGDGWGTNEDAVCFGAGGAGSAVVLSLLYELHDDELRPRSLAPRRLVVVDLSSSRLTALRNVLERLPASASEITFARHSEPAENDTLLDSLPAGSLVANLTGMGKDAPGSPVSPSAVFPESAVVWDANYRGELPFLRIARAQQGRSGLRVHDGWDWFVHGWAEALAPALDLEVTDPLLDRLGDLAAAHEPISASR